MSDGRDWYGACRRGTAELVFGLDWEAEVVWDCCCCVWAVGDVRLDLGKYEALTSATYAFALVQYIWR